MYKHLTVFKQMSSGLFKNVIYKMCANDSYIICMKRIWH